MSEDFSEDFVIEEEEGSSRTFLIIAGSLVGLFIVITVAILIVAFVNRAQRRSEVAEIESANATTMAENLLVTQTIAARQTEAARPTNTPTQTPTVAPTATATQTTAPTETPVVQQPEEEDTATPTIAGTSIFGTGGVFGATPTPVPGTGAAALPKTGVNAAGVAAAVLGLLLLAVAARRLRAS